MDEERIQLAIDAWHNWYDMTLNGDEETVQMLEEEDWRSMAIGFFIAKGVDEEKAYELAHLRGGVRT